MKRNILSEQEKIELVREYIKSGLGYRPFYKQNKDRIKVSERSFWEWTKKYRHIAEIEQGQLYDGHHVKGTSTLYDTEGNIRLQWVKTDKEKEEKQNAYAQIFERLSENIIHYEPKEFKSVTSDNLCSTYIISDFHLGQLSSLKEAGATWDLDEAANVLKRWIEKATHQAPFSKQAILCDLGDSLHADGLTPATPASGHILDASARFRDVVDVAIEIFDYAIQVLLDKHESVHVIIAEGNHNESSSYWQTKAIARRYENEPRVTFDFSHIPYYSYQWGETALYFHHGHKKKMGDVAKTLVANFREVYGTSKYNYGHMGHLHHRDMKECALMVMEQHSTLAAKDAYSARGGYYSERGAVVITYHNQYGEVGRSCIRPEMCE